MNKAEAVKSAAIQRIGCPYVMGGTGKKCTPAYRQARATQYPDYADKIRANCPRMKGSATTCKNCKWADPETGEGRPCYDCAQLNLAAFAAVGIPLVSGANSQWLKTVWSEKGTIDSLPRDKVCSVFRKDSDGKMHHVGVYLGDGTVVHARGHAYGVVRQNLEDIDKPFTHWGIPAGLYDNGLPTLRRGNSGAYVKAMQEGLCNYGITVETDGKFGKNTEDAVKRFQADQKLGVDGICGPKTWDKLKEYTPLIDPEAPETPDDPGPDWDDDKEPAEGIVRVDRGELVKLIDQLEAMRDQLDGLAYTARGWIE